jgi:predicted RNA-binding protein (virulence factor B family)
LKDIFMVEIGKINRLQMLRKTEFGIFLDGGTLGDILLPNRYAPDSFQEGDALEVFVFLDSEDRLTATTERPMALADQFAYLRVVSTTPVGAFLDWGMPKDLLVPFREQKEKMLLGRSYIVRIYLDRASNRLVASSKIDKFLDLEEPSFAEGDEVDLLIAARTDLGYKAIVNQRFWGMIFHNQVFKPLSRGTQTKGFVKQVRPDGKIDLTLQKTGYEKVTDLAEQILQFLKEEGGFLPFDAKSSAEDISKNFGVSKKSFKQALGALYKKRLVLFENGGTRLV